MPNFDEYLSKPVGDIKETVLPPGHYAATVKNFEPVESSGNNGKPKRPMLKVQFAVQSAYDDVDPALLPKDGVSKTLTNNFMLDQEFGQIQIKGMLEAAGIEMDPAQGLGTYLPQLQNRAVKLYIDTRTMDDGREVENIKKVLAAD